MGQGRKFENKAMYTDGGGNNRVTCICARGIKTLCYDKNTILN